MNDLNKIPTKNKELAWRVIDGETVIIPLNEQSEGSEKMDFLNETATYIWELIDGKNSIKNIIDKVCQEYEIIFKDARKEVLSFIKKVKDKNLINIGSKDR